MSASGGPRVLAGQTYVCVYRLWRDPACLVQWQTRLGVDWCNNGPAYRCRLMEEMLWHAWKVIKFQRCEYWMSQRVLSVCHLLKEVDGGHGAGVGWDRVVLLQEILSIIVAETVNCIHSSLKSFYLREYSACILITIDCEDGHRHTKRGNNRLFFANSANGVTDLTIHPIVKLSIYVKYMIKI